jgi:hypothetical protein
VSDPDHPSAASSFEEQLAADQRVEDRLPWKELAALALVAVVIVVRALWWG